MRSSYIENKYGNVLKTISYLQNPKLVVEFGILDGYSLDIFVNTVSDDCEIHAYDMFDELDEDAQQNAIRQFWQARGDLHKAGFSHNDMHGGNVYVDPKTGEVSIIDLGLAKDDPFSALMEATGGFDAEEGEDTQLAYHMAGARVPDDLRERMMERLGGLEESLLDSYDGDMEDEEGFDEAMRVGGNVMRGGIRMSNDRREEILGMFPQLGNREFVMPLIERLYEGLTDFGEEEAETPVIDAVKDAKSKPKAKGGKPGVTTRVADLKKQGVRTKGLAAIRKILDLDD